MVDTDQKGSNVRSAIDGCLNPTTAWPVAFYPPYWSSSSDTKYAKLLDRRGYWSRNEESKNEEFLYELLFMEVQLT